MNGTPFVLRLTGRELVVIASRWVLGCVFVYSGMSKALHPVEFLKLLRQYEMGENQFVLNSIAIALPWFEVFCGTFLVAGIGVRGSALISLFLLVPFSLIVLQRAWAIHVVSAVPFCAIRFDCGCGGGEVIICHKLATNILLITLSSLVLAIPAERWCMRYRL
jgi:uncharacterized membrane protein YphA (DoxX/SURF4 family)